MKTLLAAGGALALENPSANEVLRAFVTHAGGDEARVVIVALASAEPQETSEAYTAVFQALGVRHITTLSDLTERTQAPTIDLTPLQTATGIYLSGGNQLRFTTLVNDTAVAEALHAAYERGAVIFGSSAGTAVLSRLMLAYGESGHTPRQGMAHFASGLGLLDGVIFDQHFSQRGRLGRLLTAVANNPQLLGVGIDENTAVFIQDTCATVLGQHGVTLIDGQYGLSNAADRDPSDLITLTGYRLHHLAAGATFDLSTRTVCLSAERRAFA
ncbi:MAG: cyanophycinase [Anaerolineales bacterium]|nr:cyanophycinase [Anaerolineales bacterium]